MTLLRAAALRLDFLKFQTIALLFLGNAALLALGWLGLFIPDSHVWQFIFQMLLAAALLISLVALYATVIRRLYPPARRVLWQSILLLAGWLLLGLVFQHLAGRLSTGVDARAGYWNSQLSPHHRALFPYERLVNGQNLAIEALMWIVIPGLLLPFAVETISRTERPWRTAAAVLKSVPLWLTVALFYSVGSRLCGFLIAWHPAHSVHGELVSLILRSALVYCFAIALLLVTLAVVAELLAREHARRNPTR